MTIDKNKLGELASDAHAKQAKMQELHQALQKGGSAVIAADYAIAKVEYNRAKNLLDLEVREQSTTIVQKPTVKATGGEAA